MAPAPRRDTEEFCDFVMSRSAALFRVAYLIVGEYQLAQDLVQESLEKTYVAWPRLREVANAEAYTRRVIATTATSWSRRRSFHERPVEYLPEPAGEDPAAGVVVHDALWAALLALPPRQRAAIVLRHYVDLSEAETAEAHGVLGRRREEQHVHRVAEASGAHRPRSGAAAPRRAGGGTMNLDLQELLARRADTVGAPDLRPACRRRPGRAAHQAPEPHRCGRGRARPGCHDGGDRPGAGPGQRPAAPADRPDGDGLTWTPGTRPITYGQEQTLHLGTRQIETGIDFLSVAVTDDGAALTTIDGGIWFTDGQTVEAIGSTLGGRGEARRRGLARRPAARLGGHRHRRLPARLAGVPRSTPRPPGTGGLRHGPPRRAGPGRRSRCPTVARRTSSPSPIEGFPGRGPPWLPRA